MATHDLVKIFDSSKIRVVWDDEQEKYFFSVVDVVSVLTESADGRKYWNKLKQRLKEEGSESVTNCHQLKLQATDGKRYSTDVADAARQNLEQRLGRSVISSRRAVNFTAPPDELPLPKDPNEDDEITDLGN